MTLAKKAKESWNELSLDLQAYFIKHAAIILFISLLEIPFDIVIKEKSTILLLLLLTLSYLSYVAFVFFKALMGKILLFEGVCESVSIKRKDFSRPVFKSSYSVYGKSTMMMSIKAETDEAKFVIPIPGNSEMKEGNIVRVYSLESSIITKNDNTFEITNPIIVKVSKS